MKLFFYRGEHPNFGDELNAWLWPRIFGDIFNEDDSQIFLGIGSILFRGVFRAASRKVVFGAGYAGYTPLPDISDGSWKFYFVRGPRTARAFGLDSSVAITDPAVLIRTQHVPRLSGTRTVAFMPHFQSMDRGRWAEVCVLAGVKLIDPRAPVELVMSQIASSTVLITEAMHGAIAADALRVPWIPVSPLDPAHRSKWADWTDSIRVPYMPAQPIFSNAKELWTRTTGRSWFGKHARTLADAPLMRAAESPLVHRAAVRIVQLSQSAGCLSSDKIINSLTEQILERVEEFRRDVRLAQPLLDEFQRRKVSTH